MFTRLSLLLAVTAIEKSRRHQSTHTIRTHWRLERLVARRLIVAVVLERNFSRN